MIFGSVLMTGKIRNLGNTTRSKTNNLLWIRWRYFFSSENIDQVLIFRQSFTNNSVLSFTYELEKSKKLNFLDVTMTTGSNGLMTYVYIKPTYDNPTLKYVSIAPLKYKFSTIKTILHRGFAVSGSWNAFTAMIKCLLNNKNFTIKIMDTKINKLFSSKLRNL